MAAKEKAKELRNKYTRIKVYITALDSDGERIGAIGYMSYESAKQCAIIAVDEIIKAIPYYVAMEGYGSAKFNNPDIAFWQEVKTELEKL